VTPVPGSSAQTTGYYASVPGMSHLVYLNPMRPVQGTSALPVQVPPGTAGVPIFLPMSGMWPPLVPSTPSTVILSPSASRSATGKAADAAVATPTRPGTYQGTPKQPLERTESQGLDSLLSAARMLEDGDFSDNSTVATPTHAARSKRKTKRAGPVGAMALATPSSKRMRIGPETPGSRFEEPTPVHSPTPKGRTSTLRRISSALDVLADQAAQEQERRPSVGNTPRCSAEPAVQMHEGAVRRQASGSREASRSPMLSGDSSKKKGLAVTCSSRPSSPSGRSSPDASLSHKARRISRGHIPNETAPPLSFLQNDPNVEAVPYSALETQNSSILSPSADTIDGRAATEPLSAGGSTEYFDVDALGSPEISGIMEAD
jgi:hypothetical protein